MAEVVLEKITKVFPGHVTAVDRMDLNIRDQEFIVLVGPSGCGKSTTLRMIAGLEEITEGTIRIGERIVNDVPPKNRDIAMVFQNYALYPHMTVYKNMAFGLKLRKFPKQEIDARVKEAAGILDIEELLDRRPKALSGGQRQRVAVGRAIVRHPKVFLFDEPLSNLDAKLRVQMRAEISALHNRLKATMIYVTHDQVEAMTMGDKIVVMRDGVIQQIGAPLELYNHPVNRFVAAFIGSPPMNLCRLQVKEDGGGVVINENSFSIRIDGKQADDLKPYIGKEIYFGVRPEDLLYQEHPSAQNNIRMKVEVIEPLGAEIHLYVATKDNTFIARIPPRYEFHVGDEINLTPDKSRLHFFDPDTEKSLEAG